MLNRIEVPTQIAPVRGAAKGPSSDPIYERILIAITEHRLPPGTQLVEDRPARVFDAVRAKVREAAERAGAPMGYQIDPIEASLDLAPAEHADFQFEDAFA